jgi:hypothetical protein
MSTRSIKGGEEDDEDDNDDDEDEDDNRGDNRSRLERQEMLEETRCQRNRKQKEERIGEWMIEKEVLRRRKRERWAKKYKHCQRATGGNGGGPFLAASLE